MTGEHPVTDTSHNEPTTKEGRALARAGAERDCIPADDWFGMILAIEAEAREQERARIASAVRELPLRWPTETGESLVLRTEVLAAIKEKT